MIYALHNLELTLICNGDTFLKLRSKSPTEDKHLMKQDAGIYIDNTLLDKGILVEYHDNTLKKKIKMIVNPTILLGGDNTRKLWKSNDDNISKLLRKLEKRIGRYFDGLVRLDDFKLTRVDFAVNFDVGD